ncbi:Omp28-related outer membrane protein [bacterium]|nr:Omp28-related outer membrane protein [bacterium]
MRRIHLFSFMALSALATTACYDDAAKDLINFTPFVPVEDTTYIDLDTNSKAAPQDKGVLITEFTGSSCTNCPSAAAIVKDLKTQYPTQVVGIGVHAGAATFVNPNKEHSHYDFRTQDGNSIASMLGGVLSLPAGAVDMVKYEDQSSVIMTKNFFQPKTQSRVSVTNPLVIDVPVMRIDADTLIFLVRVLYKEDVADDKNYLSVYITENGIIDFQESLTEIILDYEHEHVFRKAVTSYSGDLMELPAGVTSYDAGRVFQRRFVVPIKHDTPGEQFKTGWNYQNLNVVAVVHRKTDVDFEVIHVVEKHTN